MQSLHFFLVLVIAYVLVACNGSLMTDNIRPTLQRPTLEPWVDRTGLWFPHTPTNESCASCESIVYKLGQVADNPSEIALIIKEINTTCYKLGLSEKEEKLCSEIGAFLVNLLPEIKGGLMQLEWDTPEALCSVMGKCAVECCSDKWAPEQMRLSLTDKADASEMVVSWTSLLGTEKGIVEYGYAADQLSETATSPNRTYQWAGWIGQIFSATMVDLKPNTTVYYRVSSDGSTFSDVTSFKTLPSNIGSDARPLRVAVVGDMAYDSISDDTVTQLIKLVEADALDMVLHVGDIGYADGYQRHWDVFMRKVQPIASVMPYMVCPGNHEFWFGFAAYKTRFFMPNNAETLNMYYSWDVLKAVHFTGYNTETYVDTGAVLKPQPEWIGADLAQAQNSTWRIAYGHRPLYCSTGSKSCNSIAATLRSKIEDELHDNNVDLVIGGHVHYYERTYPVYANATVTKDYSAPGAPAYITNGAGGNREGEDTYHQRFPYSAAGSNFVSYGIMTIADTSLTYTQFNSSDNVQLDTFTITKK